MTSLLVHELLAGLLDHPSDLIVPIHSSPSDSSLLSLKLSPTLSFISPSERQRINSLLHLGLLYHHLLAFISPPSPSPPTPPQLYLSALRQSLATLLASYRSTLLHAEQSAATSSTYPLSSLQLSLQPFALLFPSLVRLTAAATTGEAVGSQLAGLVHGYTHTGYPLLAAAYRTLLHALHRVLLAQVECFCVYGRLHDPQGEFFIGRVGGGEAEGCGKGEVEGDDRYAAVWDGYVVRPAMVPAHLSSALVDRILFLGRAVCILQLAAPSATAAVSSPLFLTPPFLAALSALSGLRNRGGFAAPALEAALVPLHRHVGERLSALLLGASDVAAHLRALHSFVLLGDASFTHFLVSHTSPLLTSPPTPHAVRELAAALQAALAAAGMAGHPQAALLTLTLDPAAFHYPLTTTPTAFHCRGDFHFSPHALHGGRGAVWYLRKLLVEHGWEAAVTVRWASPAHDSPVAGDTPIGWGLCLQNEGLHAAAERRRSEVGEDGPLHGGLVNALLVEVIAYTTGAGVRRERVAVYHYPHPSATALTPPTPTCLKAVTGLWGLFDLSSHRFNVAYTAGVEGGEGTLAVSLEGQQPPVLTVELRLQGTVHLDLGRAWVGLVSSGGGPQAGEASISELQWKAVLTPSQPLLAWRDLRLGYKVTGPLALILRPGVFDRYASLFRFLFELTQCQQRLQGSWLALGGLRARRTGPLPAPLPALLGLRQSLHFFVSTVLHHLYQAVIQPSLAGLLVAVQGTRDFMEVRRAHEGHLATVVQGCWVRDRVVMGAIREVMWVAGRVAQGVEEAGGKGAGEEGEEMDAGWVEEAREEWERLGGLLFTLWTRKANVLGNPALSHLLTSLDFNGYLSRLAIHAGLQRLAE